MSQKDVKIEKFKLSKKEKLTHDTCRFVFDLPEREPFVFLPGDHMKIYPDAGDPLEYRPYTPTSTSDETGFFELTIKRYPDGHVSRYMHNRAVGDEIAMSGPHQGGHFADGMARHIGMVAGGTGITPMISIIRSILRRGLDVEISLVFANKTVDDIILKDEFDGYAENKPNFRRYYVLDQAPPGWGMGVGRIDKDMMKAKLPAPSDDTVIFVCGPPMMQLDLRKRLLELGHSKERVIFP